MKNMAAFFAFLLGLRLFLGTFFGAMAYEDKAYDLTVPKERIARMTYIIENEEVKSLFGGSFLRESIREAVREGVSPNTIVLLFLFPLVAGLVAFSRQVVGLSGFGLLTPAILAVAFLSTGGVVGLGLLSFVVLISILGKTLMKKIRLPYLPKLAVLIWIVSLLVMTVMVFGFGLGRDSLSSIGIFPIILFVLLAETFIESQITKSFTVSLGMLVETVILALVAYKILSSHMVQEMVLVNPEVSAVTILFLDLLIGRYKGLRFLEMWRFRKLIIR